MGWRAACVAVVVAIGLSGCSTVALNGAGAGGDADAASAPPVSPTAAPTPAIPTDTPMAVPTHTLAAPRSPGVAAELAYVRKYWWHRNVKNYGDLGTNDCANFTSQALTARGWTQTAGWNHSLSSTGGNAYSPAWISSTAMMRYLEGHPELATAVSDNQRSKLAVGDIAQFDYDNSGDRDHTSVITRITSVNGHLHVYVAAHTDLKQIAYEYRSVDTVRLSHGTDGTVYYWHLAG